MINEPLTHRQERVLASIREMIASGEVPTIRLIGSRLGIKSPNGVVCHLKALERKGMIERDSLLAGAIRLKATPIKLEVLSVASSGGVNLYEATLTVGPIRCPIGQSSMDRGRVIGQCENIVKGLYDRGVHVEFDRGDEASA